MPMLNFPSNGYGGSGKSASADGTKWDFPQNLMSEYHIRYGGYGGIGYYLVADSYIALFSRFSNTTGRRTSRSADPREGKAPRAELWPVAFEQCSRDYFNSGDELHFGYTGMRGDDFPAVVKLLEVHRAVSHRQLLGTGEGGRPPRECKCEIRLQQLDLDACGSDESHRITVRITIDVGIVKLLPAVKLFSINHNQQFWRFPIHLQMSFDVVGNSSDRAF
jgi:hypothetical protein